MTDGPISELISRLHVLLAETLRCIKDDPPNLRPARRKVAYADVLICELEGEVEAILASEAQALVRYENAQCVTCGAHLDSDEEQGKILASEVEVTPEGWIDRWREADDARRSALESLKLSRQTNDAAFEFIRTFRDKLGEHARVGVLGQLWLEANRLVGVSEVGTQRASGDSSSLPEIEKLRVALSQHRDVSFRLGAIYALDEITGIIRRNDR